MDEFTRNLLLYAAIPIILGIGRYIMKSYIDRIDALERDMPHKLTESEVRVLMSDKVDPIKEDIQELKQQCQKILDILINSKKI